MAFGIPTEYLHGGFGLPEPDEEVKCASNSRKDELVDDLNLILKSNFDYVPIYKTIEIVDAIIKKGWKFDK